MRGDDVLRAAAFLHCTEPGITRAARCGLRRVGPETQLGELEWQSEFLGELFDRPADRPSGRENAVVTCATTSSSRSSSASVFKTSSNATEAAPPDTATSASPGIRKSRSS